MRSVRAIGETALQEDLAVTMRFSDGSVATVTYAEHGHPSALKERLEILGRGRSVVIEDFQKLEIDGKAVKLDRPGKGHVENLQRFAAALTGSEGSTADERAAIASTAATLAAARSLAEGVAVAVDPRVGREPFA